MANASVTYEKLDANVVLEIMKLIYPIGDTKTMYNNNNPPFHNVGMTWALIEDGYAVISTTGNNAGTTSGANRLDTGSTTGHALNVNQIPPIAFTYKGGVYNYQLQGSGQGPKFAYTEGNRTTNTIGGNQAHSHVLNVRTIKLRIWRRTA